MRRREAACAQKMRRLVGMCVGRLRKGITRVVCAGCCVEAGDARLGIGWK